MAIDVPPAQVPASALLELFDMRQHSPRSVRPALAWFRVIGLPGTCSDILATPQDYRAFQLAAAASLPRALRLVAYCLMPTRFHLIVGTHAGHAGPAALTRWVGQFTGTDPGRDGVVVAPLPTIGDLVRVTRDVERLPLQGGLVRRAQDWPWGSLAGRLDAQNPWPLIPARFLETRTWTDYVNRPSDPTSIHVSHYPRRLPRCAQRPENRRGL